MAPQSACSTLPPLCSTRRSPECTRSSFPHGLEYLVPPEAGATLGGIEARATPGGIGQRLAYLERAFPTCPPTWPRRLGLLLSTGMGNASDHIGYCLLVSSVLAILCQRGACHVGAFGAGSVEPPLSSAWLLVVEVVEVVEVESNLFHSDLFHACIRVPPPLHSTSAQCFYPRLRNTRP